jgi:poly-gamma-glutamate synthesis protein (capsule biosynthesis protein)
MLVSVPILGDQRMSPSSQSSRWRRLLALGVLVVVFALAGLVLVGRAFGNGPQFVASAPLAGAVASPSPGSGFQGSIRPLTAQEQRWMTGQTWHSGCPVPIDHLRLLTLSYYNFDGNPVSTGRLVINRKVATDVLSTFETLYNQKFPLWDVDATDLYPADQRPDHLRDVTVGFNCRPIGGTTIWSQHAFGLAVDVNPVQNPEVVGDKVVPRAGRDYVDRSQDRTGMIHKGDSTVHAFSAIGWGWGGNWHSKKDYMHFSLTGG